MQAMDWVSAVWLAVCLMGAGTVLLLVWRDHLLRVELEACLRELGGATAVPVRSVALPELLEDLEQSIEALSETTASAEALLRRQEPADGDTMARIAELRERIALAHAQLRRAATLGTGGASASRG